MSKFVERPKGGLKGGRQFYDYDAFIATADNGKAVEVACKPGNRAGTGSNISAVLGRRGFRAHTTYDPKRQILTIWCERVNGRP